MSLTQVLLLAMAKPVAPCPPNCDSQTRSRARRKGPNSAPNGPEGCRIDGPGLVRERPYLSRPIGPPPDRLGVPAAPRASGSAPAQPAVLSNSPFLAPSTKHSHSWRLYTKTRPLGSPEIRMSTQRSPNASTNATSMAPVPSPERRQV